MTQQQFGQTLRETRLHYCNTLKDVATHLGVATSTVWNMEKGKYIVNTEELKKINHFFGTKLKFPGTTTTKTTTSSEQFKKVKTNFLKFLNKITKEVEAL